MYYYYYLNDQTPAACAGPAIDNNYKLVISYWYVRSARIVIAWAVAALYIFSKARK